MARILVHVTHGPEDPTRAALGFLVAKAATEEGHEVTMFLAGDAVQLLRDSVLDSLNGLGTGSLRESYDAVVAACEALGKNAEEHVHNYGFGIEHRLTGLHETAPWNEFSYGVSDRGASVRIPWQVEKDGKGYIEDRRPNANVDPYVVTRLITDTCCAALEKAGQA